MKKHLYIVMVILAALSGNAFTMETPQKPTNGCVEFAGLVTKEDYENWLKKEELGIWQGIEKVLGITKEQCEQFKEAWKAEYLVLVAEMVKDDVARNERDAIVLTLQTQLIIKDVLEDFGCSEDVLKVIPFEKRNPAGSTDDILLINEGCLPERMPKNVKQYLIGCAVAMALAKFHSTDFVLAQIAYSKGLQDSPEYLKIKQDYQTFKEVSADIRTMLLKYDYVEAQNRYLQLLMNQYGDEANASDWARYHIGRQMAQTLK